MDKKIAEAEVELERYDAAIREADAENEIAADYLREASAKVCNAQSEKEDVNANLGEKMSDRHDLQAEQRRIREHLKSAEESAREIQYKIEQETQRLADLHGGGYSRKQEELERARQDAMEASRRSDEHLKGVDRINEDMNTAERKERAAAAPVAQARRDVEEAESVLRNLSRDGESRSSGYPDKMPALIKAIQQEQGFTERPVGPIGNFVTLLKPEWSSVLESSFGATLNSFIVTSKKDQAILSRIMQRVNWSVLV
ncbi:hypothetical protein BJX61DRAFT_395646 [Aspergillus egyptiacus]|nr:hypothetical protein BJX61DRAFT_395646 [Aspergillus egyptiacus]